MRTTTLLLLGLGVALAAACQPKADITAETAAINGVLKNYIVSIEKEDLDLYGRVMAHDPGMMNFGTSGEPIVGWEALRQLIAGQNAALSETKITARDVTVHLASDGRFAWATSLWNFKAMVGSASIDLPVRCTWILEKQKDGWAIVHFHKSVKASA
jgi:ketosteroid isomerase-like protein